jgi:hypothetical protein
VSPLPTAGPPPTHHPHPTPYRAPTHRSTTRVHGCMHAPKPMNFPIPTTPHRAPHAGPEDRYRAAGTCPRSIRTACPDADAQSRRCPWPGYRRAPSPHRVRCAGKSPGRGRGPTPHSDKAWLKAHQRASGGPSVPKRPRQHEQNTLFFTYMHTQTHQT